MRIIQKKILKEILASFFHLSSPSIISFLHLSFVKNLILLLLLSSLPSYAIDLQSKIRNSDKGLFETVPDYQILDPYEFNFAISSSYTSKPLVEKNSINGKTSEKVLIDSLFDTEFSASMGIFSFMELGILLPTMKTMGVDKSAGQDTFSTGDLFIETKFSLMPGLSLIPSVILPTGDSANFTGTPEGGWGLRLVGSTYEWIKIPLFFSLGSINTPNSKYRSINHEQRTQFSLGYLYSLNEKLSLASEVYGDKSENNFPIELLAHATYNTNSVSIRGGLGSGFLANDSSNELKIFASLVFDFGKFKSKKFNPVLQELNRISKRKSKKRRPSIPKVKEEKTHPKKTKIIKLKEFKEVPKVTPKEKPIEVKKQPIKEEKKADPFQEKVDSEMKEIKELMKRQNRSPSSEQKFNVLPFYSAKKLEKEKNEEEKIKSYNKILKNYKKGLKTLHRVTDQYEDKTLSLEDALVEINWGLNISHKRRVKLLALKKEISSSIEDIPLDDVIFKARKIFKEHTKTFKKIVRKERKKLKEEDDVEDDTQSLSQEEERIKKEQEAAWKVAKTHTLQDLIKEGKIKSKIHKTKVEEAKPIINKEDKKIVLKETVKEKEAPLKEVVKTPKEIEDKQESIETIPSSEEKLNPIELVSQENIYENIKPVVEAKLEVKKINFELPSINIMKHQEILEVFDTKTKSSYQSFYDKYKKKQKSQKMQQTNVELKKQTLPVYVIKEDNVEIAKPEFSEETKKEAVSIVEIEEGVKDEQTEEKPETVKEKEEVVEYQDFVILEDNQPVLIEQGEIQKSSGPSF